MINQLQKKKWNSKIDFRKYNFGKNAKYRKHKTQRHSWYRKLIHCLDFTF